MFAIFFTALIIHAQTANVGNSGKEGPFVNTWSGNNSFNEALNYVASNQGQDLVIYLSGTFTPTNIFNLGGGNTYVVEGDGMETTVLQAMTDSDFDGGTVVNNLFFYIHSGATLSISDLSIQNTRGSNKKAAVGVSNSPSTIFRNVKFKNNYHTSGDAAAIRFQNCTATSIDGCVFENNSGTKGSAIYAYTTGAAMNIVVDNSTFKNNVSTTGDGAVFMWTSNKTNPFNATFGRNVFFNNTGASGAGAIGVEGNITSVNLINNTSAHNTGQHGIILYGDYTSLTATNNLLYDNSAGYDMALSDTPTGTRHINNNFIGSFQETDLDLTNNETSNILNTTDAHLASSLTDNQVVPAESSVVYDAGIVATPYTDGINASKINIGAYAPPINYNKWLGVDSDWTNTANWIKGTVPVATDSLDIQTGLENYPVIGATTGVTVDVLTIASGATFTLQSTSTRYSSIIATTVSNSGTINYERHVNTVAGSETTTGANDLISAPLSGQAFNDFATANANLARYTDAGSNDATFFGPYNNSSTPDYEKWLEDVTTTIDAGIGYRAASTDTSTLTFTGTVNTGDVDVNITSGTNAWNLIGNPYPSYINAFDFLNGFADDGSDDDTLKNIDLLDDATKAIYGYDGAALDGWVIYNLNTDAGTLIAPGQGFFVNADPADVATYDIKFNAAQRSTGTTDDFISGKGKPSKKTANYHLELQLESDSKAYKTNFYFNDNSSLGLDPGYDAALYKSTAPNFAVYSHLVEENTGLDMGIQSLSIQDLEAVTIPLGINAKGGEEFTVSIATSTLEVGTYVYLKDHTTNELTLLNDTDFSLTPSEDLSSTGNFSLVFSGSEILAVDELNGQDALEIYTSSSEKIVHINGVLNDATSVAVYDIQGRNILSQTLDRNNSSNRIDVANLKAGIYIVQVSSNSLRQTKKVLIN